MAKFQHISEKQRFWTKWKHFLLKTFANRFVWSIATCKIFFTFFWQFPTFVKQLLTMVDMSKKFAGFAKLMEKSRKLASQRQQVRVFPWNSGGMMYSWVLQVACIKPQQLLALDHTDFFFLQNFGQMYTLVSYNWDLKPSCVKYTRLLIPYVLAHIFRAS